MTDRSERVVRTDRWDDQDWAETAEQVQRLSDVATELADVAGAPGADIVADTFQGFFQAEPALLDRSLVDPERVINHAVMGELLECDDYRRLHDITTGDRVASAMASISMQETLSGIYERTGDAMKAEIDQLKDALSALDAATSKAASDEPCDPGEVEEAQQAVEDAQGVVDGVLGGCLGGIGRDVRRAASAAREEAEEAAAQMASWGVGGSERGRMDASAYLALAERLRTPRLRRIAELLGAIRSLTWGARRTKVNRVPEEIHDVTLGDDLGRVLPSELALLSDNTLEDEFYRRYANRELMVYELEGVERIGRGSIIYVEDGSGSMRHGGAVKEMWSKAVGLALLGIAKDEGRGFHAVHFGGAGEVKVISFPEPAAFTTERMLDYAETFLNSSGTHFETGLDAAMALVAAEHAATGKVTADIVFATDGDAHVPDTWLAAFDAAKAQYGVKVYGLAIGTSSSHPVIQSICDGRVADVRDLHSGEDARDIFAGVS